MQNLKLKDNTRVQVTKHEAIWQPCISSFASINIGHKIQPSVAKQKHKTKSQTSTEKPEYETKLSQITIVWCKNCFLSFSLSQITIDDK